MKLQWNFVGLLGARGVKLTLGLAMMFAYARIFGVSATYDAWIWALGIVNAVGMLLFGPITETIRASYTSIDHRDGRLAAEQYIATIAVMMIGTAVVVAVIAMTALPAIAAVLVPRQSEQNSTASFFLYALAPSMVLSQIVAVLTAHLNCRGKVYAPEIAGIVGGCIGLTLVVTFPHVPDAWLLLGSYYFTLLAPLVVGASFWPELFRALLKLKWPVFRAHAREALAFSMPLLLPYALGQIGGIVERQYALLAGTGALSVLSYAFFARNTVQAVFTAALSAIAVPALARAWNAEDRVPFRAALAQWSRQCLMLVTVGMIVLFGLSDMIPVVMFGDNIAADHQLLLGKLLRIYAVVIVAVVLYLIGGSALLAARRGKAYAALGTAASIVSTLILVALFPLMETAAIPVGLGISHLLAAALMFRAIDRSDMWHVLRDAGIRMIAVWTVGSALHLIDGFAVLLPGIVPRLSIVFLAAAAAGGLWWLVEHYIVDDAAPTPIG